MTAAKLNNLKEMKKVAESKKSYGISQVNVEFSSKENLISDSKAVYGKKILREKIYRNA